MYGAKKTVYARYMKDGLISASGHESDTMIMKDHNMTNICPICGEPYTEPPAISRLDNTTLICSSCSIREAVGGLLKPEDVEEIVAKNKELYRSINGT